MQEKIFRIEVCLSSHMCHRGLSHNIVSHKSENIFIMQLWKILTSEFHNICACNILEQIITPVSDNLIKLYSGYELEFIVIISCRSHYATSRKVAGSNPR
jgi:hypothetical protein